MTHDIRIRPMGDSDAALFTEVKRILGWQTERELFLARMQDQAKGRVVALVAECDGEPAGCIQVHLNGRDGPFANRGWPKITDFAVLERFRGRGVGSKLMDAAEEVAARHAHTMYLGVGLHAGYGAAQRMFIRRGYVPDGSGIWYRNRPCPLYEPCCNDDELTLYLYRRLKEERDDASR